MVGKSKGDDGNDRITGSDVDDICYTESLFGEDGNDSGPSGGLFGLGGDDILWGGEGEDVLVGGAGDDVLWGEDGPDFLYGSEGDDELHGGNGNDTMEGWTGNDTMNGDAGNDELIGFEGDDILRGGDGSDDLHGREGNDVLVGGDGDDDLNGHEGDDILCDTTGLLVCATVGVQILDGGSDDDTLWYDTTSACGVASNLDTANSDAGLGNDDCGNTAKFSSAQLPASCENDITSSPHAECDP